MSNNLLLLVAPLLLIELVLMVVALIDLARRERVRWGHKLVWLVIILILGIIGPVVYLMFGREDF